MESFITLSTELTKLGCF